MDTPSLISTMPALAADAKIQAAKQTATAAGASGDNREARKAAEEFEAVFIAQMLQPMFDTIEEDALFGGGHAEKMYRTMMVDEMAKEISAAGGVGIADHVYREMMKMQEA